MSVKEFSAISPFSFQALREQRLAESTREFLARGKSVQRCVQCQLATFACICNWVPQIQSQCEFILLMHRDEVFKPTNTGRLVADVLPGKTHVFCWSRTEPNEALVKILGDPDRECLIVFPLEAAEASEKSRPLVTDLRHNQKIKTFILLDGTWKQSGRMFHLSRWLDEVACVALPEPEVRGYAVRQSHQDHYVSTAEAAALCLQLVGESQNAEILRDYFSLFNVHYLATRGSYPPEIGELHQRLAAFKQANN